MEKQLPLFFQRSLADDPLTRDALADEAARQQSQIELIASENIVSPAVLAALGHAMTNKTLEGYPGNRFHGGGQFVDVDNNGYLDIFTLSGYYSAPKVVQAAEDT